jgi:WD40 repeat protein
MRSLWTFLQYTVAQSVDQAHEDSIWSVSWTGGATNKLVTGGVDEHVKVWYANMAGASENAAKSRGAGHMATRAHVSASLHVVACQSTNK